MNGGTFALLLVTLCLIPAAVIRLCHRFAWMQKIGPILLLYAIGMMIGNLGIAPNELKTLQEILPNVVVPLAIPMMLYGCTFTRHEATLQIKIIASGFISVTLAIIIGYLTYGKGISEGNQVGGILTGMYTGGTLNAAALQTIFKIRGETYVLLNTYDIVISFIYFVFLFTIGIQFFRWIYREKRSETNGLIDDGVSDKPQSAPEKQEESRYHLLLKRSGRIQALRIVGITLCIILLSGGIALLLPSQWFTVVFILVLTTLGVAASFIRPIRQLELSYDMGMYLIYIFSLTIATMADFSRLDLMESIQLIAFMAIAVFLSLFFHALICRLLRVDADSMVISSVAFINSPPFVPMVAAAMGNKRVLITGLSAGIVGYAVGNHLGVLIAELLSCL